MKTTTDSILKMPQFYISNPSQVPVQSAPKKKLFQETKILFLLGKSGKKRLRILGTSGKKE